MDSSPPGQPSQPPAADGQLGLFPLTLETPPPGGPKPVPRLTWSDRATAFESVLAQQKLRQEDSLYSGRNRAILRMWADRDPLEKICRVTRASQWVVQWVLKVARKGEYERLVRVSPPGRRGKRQKVLEALRNGTPPAEVERQFSLHRTTVLRAMQQLKTLPDQAA